MKENKKLDWIGVLKWIEILKWIENERIKLEELGLEDDDRYNDLYVEEYLGCLDNLEELIQKDSLSKNELEELVYCLKNTYYYNK